MYLNKKFFKVRILLSNLNNIKKKALDRIDKIAQQEKKKKIMGNRC